MLNDSFPMKTVFDNAGIEVRARFITKKEIEDSGIDIVDAMRLQEITLDQEQFMAYIKGYLKAIKNKLEISGKGKRVEDFQKGATALVKQLRDEWDKVQIFTGKSGNWEAGFAFCYIKKQGDDGPTFYYFNDGLKQEKY